MGDLTDITLNGADASRADRQRRNQMAELKAKGVCDFCGEACNEDLNRDSRITGAFAQGEQQ